MIKKFYAGLFICEECGLVFASVNSTTVDIEKIYSKEYFFGQEYYNYVNDRKALERNFLSRIRGLESYISSTTRVVEVGSAFGFFLNLIRSRVKSCVGFEISDEAADYGRRTFNLDIRKNFLEYNSRADIVCMWDLIEHVSSPNAYIEKAASILSKNGIIALTTGDIGSCIALFRKERWRMIHPPTHLYYFSRNTIERLLHKHGFKIVSYSHPAVYRNIGSVMKQLQSRYKPESLLYKFLVFIEEIFVNLGLLRINFKLNLFDVMEIIAVKIYDK